LKKLFQKILLFINYIFAVALVLSHLSVLVAPDFFWPLSFFGLIYPVLLIANILFFVYWLFKWKKVAFISLLVILSGYNHLVNVLPGINKENQAPENRADKEFKVLSYNVRAFNIYEWLNDPNTNKGIFNFIRSEHPDIICLQEFFTNKNSQLSPERFQSLFGETPFEHIEYSLKNSENTGFGIATFSRYPIVSKGRIEFSNSVNMAIYSDLIIERDTVRVFNLHLQSINLRANNYAFLDSLKVRYSDQNIREIRDLSTKLKVAYIQRSRQAKEISEMVRKSPYPVIICGDFNDPPVSYAYRKIRGKLNDAWVEAGSGLGNTYTGRLPFRIDYILYDDIFRCYDFERVKTQLSDHYPILAVFRRE